MKLITTTALALAAALIASPAAAQTASPAPAAAQAPAQPQIKPSPKAVKAIVDLQTAVNAKDYANVPAKLAAAQAVATTKEDHYLIGTLQLRAADAQKDSAATAAAVDAIVQSGYLTTPKSAEMYSALGVTDFKDKQYSQAAQAFKKSVALNPNDLEIANLLGRSLFLAGQKADAASTLNHIIQTSVAAGQKPSEDLYRLAVQSAADAQSPEAAAIAQEWLTAYPSADSWRTSLAIYRNANHLDAEGDLDLFRLMQATGSLKESADYAMFAASAADQNNFNEAQSVLDAGLQSHALNPNDSTTRQLIAGIRGKPRPTVADLAVATKSAANGMALLHIGDRYYAMGDYTKAAELYRMSQGKPGVDPALANLHIGMALARSGDKAGAATALNAVSGPRSSIAKFWLAYVNQKG